MYESLLKLPYFQGMSKNELTQILDKVKFEFIKIAEGQTFVRQGDSCNRFIVLLQGEVYAEYTSANGSYRLTELLTPSHAIEPYSMFGASTNYRRSYIAKSDSNILAIDKKFFYSDFMQYNIFTINLLNLISYKAQQQSRIAFYDSPQSIEGRIARFMALRCETLTGSKRLTIKMEQLAAQLSETRMNISRALNNMQQKGLMELSRKEISIPSFNKLLNEEWSIVMQPEK